MVLLPTTIIVLTSAALIRLEPIRACALHSIVFVAIRCKRLSTAGSVLMALMRLMTSSPNMAWGFRMAIEATTLPAS